MGAPFVPTLAYAGSDVIKRRPDDFTIAANPFDPDERIVVAKAINPDVAIFHGLKADRRGNVLLRKGGEELLLIQASRKVIVTVEEIVEKVDPEASGARFSNGVSNGVRQRGQTQQSLQSAPLMDYRLERRALSTVFNREQNFRV